MDARWNATRRHPRSSLGSRGIFLQAAGPGTFQAQELHHGAQQRFGRAGDVCRRVRYLEEQQPVDFATEQLQQHCRRLGAAVELDLPVHDHGAPVKAQLHVTATEEQQWDGANECGVVEEDLGGLDLRMVEQPGVVRPHLAETACEQAAGMGDAAVEIANAHQGAFGRSLEAGGALDLRHVGVESCAEHAAQQRRLLRVGVRAPCLATLASAGPLAAIEGARHKLGVPQVLHEPLPQGGHGLQCRGRQAKLVAVAPLGLAAARLGCPPAIEGLDHRQVVAPQITERLVLLALEMLLAPFAAKAPREGRLLRQARCNSEHRAEAAHKGAVDQHLACPHVHGHVRQVEAEGRERHALGDGAERTDLHERLQGSVQGRPRGRLGGALQEVARMVAELQQSELQNELLQGRPPHLAQRVLGQMPLEEVLRAQPPADTWPHAARPAGALLCRGLRHEARGKDAHAAVGVVAALLDVPAIDDVGDVVDGDGRLRDVRAQDHLPLPCWCRFEDLALLVRGHLTMQGQEPGPRANARVAAKL
mmetsp:Transcript_44330/g.128263  ORF Transcript_44330/g.128263 Transcript_44330/m.128263 type:complete len:534 (-) Transcript_44330:2378-3979(-)